ncbi:unnamed protein product [Ambrosiozyma monospora]|uniref:Unnamed protein product n=1 Tax=Ambrosiozyma monospora TaxID=43982 RepID=A0A9W6YRW5_AMBMO|nr:unnamed protein product [Ambrosiozyma monospora]
MVLIVVHNPPPRHGLSTEISDDTGGILGLTDRQFEFPTPPTQPTFQPHLSPPEPLQTSSVPSETTSQPINNARHKLMAKKKKKKKKRVRKEKKTVTDVITPGNSVDTLTPSCTLDKNHRQNFLKQQ